MNNQFLDDMNYMDKYKPKGDEVMTFLEPSEVIPCEACGDWEEERNMQDNVCWPCLNKPEEST